MPAPRSKLRLLANSRLTPLLEGGRYRAHCDADGGNRPPHQERTVRPDGAEHQWRKVPPRELSVDLVADERGGRVTGRLEAS